MASLRWTSASTFLALLLVAPACYEGPEDIDGEAWVGEDDDDAEDDDGAQNGGGNGSGNDSDDGDSGWPSGDDSGDDSCHGGEGEVSQNAAGGRVVTAPTNTPDVG